MDSYLHVLPMLWISVKGWKVENYYYEFSLDNGPLCNCRNLHGTIDALSRAQRADPRWTLCCAQATRFQLFSGESKTKVKTGEQKQRSSRRSFLHYRPGQRPIFANRNRIGIHGRRSYFSGPFPGTNVTQWQRCVIAKHALTLERSQLSFFSSAPPLLCNTSPTTGWLFN